MVAGQLPALSSCTGFTAQLYSNLDQHTLEVHLAISTASLKSHFLLSALWRRMLCLNFAMIISRFRDTVLVRFIPEAHMVASHIPSHSPIPVRHLLGGQEATVLLQVPPNSKQAPMTNFCLILMPNSITCHVPVWQLV